MAICCDNNLTANMEIKKKRVKKRVQTIFSKKINNRLKQFG